MTRRLLPDAPYHRLGAADRRGSFGLGLLLLIGAVLGLAIAAAAFTGVWQAATGGELPGPDALGEAALAFGGIALLLPIVLLAVRVAHRRPAGSVSSVTGRLRWDWLARCLAVAVAVILLTLAASFLLVPDDGAPAVFVGWQRFAVSAAVLLPLVALQSAAEEYLCRGWLLQSVGSVLRSPVVPILVQAVVFGALHGWGTPWGFVDLAWFGIVAGWLCVRTGGLEAGIALHVANNGIAMTLAAALGLLDVDTTAADAPWQLALITMTATTVYGILIALWAKRRGLRTRSAPEPALALAA